MGQDSWIIEAVERAAMQRARVSYARQMVEGTTPMLYGATSRQLIWLVQWYMRTTGQDVRDIDPEAPLPGAEDDA